MSYVMTSCAKLFRLTKMKKDKDERTSFFSSVFSQFGDYVSKNLSSIIMISVSFFTALILCFVKSVTESDGSSYLNYSSFFSSAVYHMLLCMLVFFFCSRVYFPKGFELKEIATECILYLLTFSIVVIVMKKSEFCDMYSINMFVPAVFSIYITAILFGQMSALFFSIVLSLAVLNATGYELMPFLFTLGSCLVASRIVRAVKTRSAMVHVSILQAVINIVLYELLKFVFTGSFNNFLYVIPGLAFNGFISAILCLGMLTPLEILLNTASPFRLMELSDMNSSVLKRLFSTASGTYTHSIAVAQLAENACRQINANALLARVASYYHDIGKMDNPEYFTENQGGEENLHDNLNPSLSVSIIRSHVRKGVEKGHELRLPRQVIDIISEHHGNQVISFFYNEARQKDASVNPEDYSYSGKPPSTKESAVVMLADTVEAACRSLQNKSVPSIEKFVDMLVAKKLEGGQLDNSNLTFREIDLIKKSFVQFLAGYYHSRVKYPDQKEQPEKNTQEEKTASESAAGENPPAQKEQKKTEASAPLEPAPAEERQSSPAKKSGAKKTASASKSEGRKTSSSRKTHKGGNSDVK